MIPTWVLVLHVVGFMLFCFAMAGVAVWLVRYFERMDKK